MLPPGGPDYVVKHIYDRKIVINYFVFDRKIVIFEV